MLPRAKDLVTEDDIKAWVVAAMEASMPALVTDLREAVLFAMQEHKKVLAEQTIVMRTTMEEQSRLMIKTLEVQGRTVSRLIAFGALSGVCSFMYRDLEHKPHAKYFLALGYGTGVLGIIW
eukprot:CAMPEP_0206489970 /NCGR_PEP_ID=MMETSP0324_2-20121206/43682_1 /ASSEMBLY_ACC=CAM_ASM_000836 /TAXON_ID=2866 /ORGANISM="Crypthecodinium cohnii, Strain Seligo" /LENGTH=120 /DNA_ID=CAMNT_0053970001 /DNA_START=1 /DNA_END=360 /DNA_ORIENTATION=-